jgi:hypothetical protein
VRLHHPALLDGALSGQWRPANFILAGQPGAAALVMIAIHREDWIQAISVSINHFSGLTTGTPPPIGLLGFSLGGHLAMRLRANAQVLVSFCAPMLDGIGAMGNQTYAQIHHGLADKVPGTGPENDGLIASVLKGEGTDTKSSPIRMQDMASSGPIVRVPMPVTNPENRQWLASSHIFNISLLSFTEEPISFCTSGHPHLLRHACGVGRVD